MAPKPTLTIFLRFFYIYFFRDSANLMVLLHVVEAKAKLLPLKTVTINKK